jgi:exosome complex RNA-binding protein Rrp4
MDSPLPDEFDPYGRGDMRISEGRDPLALAGIGITILVNLAGMAWIAGKFEARIETVERDISELKAKSTVDGKQDTQIAVITSELTNINKTLGKIEGKLEARK